jgi:flavin-dependent dehydrogenase
VTFDAIIVGGGPAGSSIAIALARQGRPVAVVEKVAYPRRKVCGEFISAVSLGLLDHLGVGEQVRAQAGPEVRRVALFAEGPAIHAVMPRGGASSYGRALGRDVLDTLLLEAAKAAGATVYQPGQATSVNRVGQQWEVRVEGRGTALELTAPVLIAAHGSWEPGGLPSQLPRRHRPGDFLGFKAHFRNAALPVDLMPLLAFPGGYGGMVWSDDGRLSLSCCIRRDALAALRARTPGLSAGEAVEAHIRASVPEAATVLRDAQVDGSWLAAGPIRPGFRPAYASDIFRVGNVAGESHPVIAEGISMALQSGWLLAQELEQVDWNEAGREQAGWRYGAAWRRQFAVRIAVASAVAGLASHRWSLRLMQQVVDAFPQSLFLGARLSGKVTALRGLS